MSDNTFAALMFTGVGVLYIGLGIPLYLQRIPPNAWYGARTAKTRSDERIWYAVNRVTGRDLIIGGGAVVIAAACVYLFGQQLNPSHAAGILLTVMILSVFVMVVDSVIAQGKM